MVKERNGQGLREYGDKSTAVVFACLILLCLVMLSDSVMGQSATRKKAVRQPPRRQVVDSKAEEKPQFVVPDVAVLDQNGRKLNFYTDLVKGRKVIVNFVYTTCKGVCPMSGEHFARLQAKLGARLGQDVFMISVTTDPEVDSPARLKAWSDKYHPAPGWKLVTGSKDEITKLLLVLTGDGAQTGYHVPAVCVIDDLKKSQKWNYGLAPLEEIVKMVDLK